jgi:hypothetical protein
LWKCKLWTSVIAFETKTSQVVTSVYTRNKNFSSISQDVANGLYSHEIFTTMKMNVKDTAKSGKTMCMQRASILLQINKKFYSLLL